MSSRPPRIAEWLVHRLLDTEAREAVSGDLREEHTRRLRAHGRWRAAACYWRTAVRSIVVCRITGRRRDRERQFDFAPGAGLTLRDLGRTGLRQFRTKPLYAFACVTTLAIAVGTATASFAVAKRALLDPLPYANDHELVSILTDTGGARSAVAPAIVQELRANGVPLSGIASIRPWTLVFEDGQDRENIDGGLVTSEYFQVLGVSPAMGRAFREDEPEAAVISWRFWQTALAADAQVLGRSIVLDGRARIVVGVMPTAFVPPYWATQDVWLPLDAATVLSPERGRRLLSVLARRAPGVTQEQLDGFLAAFSARTREEHPVIHARQGWVAPPLRDELVGSTRPALVATGAGALVLLLIVAVSIAGLSSADALGARQQVAVRAALGATRARLVIEQAADAFVLAAVGTFAGLGIAYALVQVVATFQRQFLGRLAPIALDVQAVAIGGAAGLLVGVFAALLPRWLAGPSAVIDMLRSSRGAIGDARVSIARSGLVAAQVALALVLTVAAGLLVRTVWHLMDMPLGFDSRGVVTFSVALPGPRYAQPDAQIRFERDLLERLEQIPGVRAATASVGVPVIGGMMAALSIQGQPAETGLHEIAYFSIAPDFVRTYGARVVAGRDLEDQDTRASAPVVVINETMARRFWPEGDALGAQVRIGAGGEGAWITVVGVMADLRQHGPTEVVRPTAFGSTLQYSWPRRHFSVRVDDERGLALAMDLRAAVRALDPTLVVGAIQPIDALISDRTARHRLVMFALVVFGTVAVVLTISGVYALFALTARLRRREYAIRLALGASAGKVRWMVLRQALLLGGAGAAAGLVIAALATRALATLLHGVGPFDVPTFALAAAALVSLAAMASWPPARRAEHVNPAETLRAE